MQIKYFNILTAILLCINYSIVGQSTGDKARASSPVQYQSRHNRSKSFDMNPIRQSSGLKPKASSPEKISAIMKTNINTKTDEKQLSNKKRDPLLSKKMIATIASTGALVGYCTMHAAIKRVNRALEGKTVPQSLDFITEQIGGYTIDHCLTPAFKKGMQGAGFTAGLLGMLYVLQDPFRKLINSFSKAFTHNIKNISRCFRSETKKTIAKISGQINKSIKITGDHAAQKISKTTTTAVEGLGKVGSTVTDPIRKAANMPGNAWKWLKKQTGLARSISIEKPSNNKENDLSTSMSIFEVEDDYTPSDNDKVVFTQKTIDLLADNDVVIEQETLNKIKYGNTTNTYAAPWGLFKKIIPQSASESSSTDVLPNPELLQSND